MSALDRLKHWARGLKRDIVALWIAARDPRVPWYAKMAAGAVAAYALSPIDIIPDFIPVFGYLDDLIIVPLLAVDAQGHRVGYGKGFYDRFLSKCRPDCLKVGLNYFEPDERIVDVGEHDIKLDACVTPTEVFCF